MVAFLIILYLNCLYFYFKSRQLEKYISTLKHDLNNTLGAIKVTCQYISEFEDITDSAGAMMQRIIDEIEKTIRIISKKDQVASALKEKAIVTARKVLVLEDDNLFGIMTRMVIEKQGHVVSLCHDPMDALKMLYEKPLFYDFILSDQNLPGMTGVEFVRRAESLDISMPPVILMSGSEIDTAIKLPDAIISTLRKPLDRKHLESLFSG